MLRSQRTKFPTRPPWPFDSIFVIRIQRIRSFTLIVRKVTRYGFLSLDRDSIFFPLTSIQNVEISKKCFKKEPAPLSRSIWVPLRKYELLRTPKEERVKLLSNATPSVLENTVFSAGLKRYLQAAVTLHSETRHLSLCFRSGETTDLDLLLEGPQVLINDKWLCVHKTHSRDHSYCPFRKAMASTRAGIDTFTCVHLVEALYGLILDELCKKWELRSRHKLCHQLREQVSCKLNQAPLKVELQHGNPGEIQVRWVERYSTTVLSSRHVR